ncbi:DNA polymerase-3 subunit delta [Sporomusaceae bacterium BoRhaA]|uniref:DNA polymerase III subunit delta n=1 Tax=Pelorhabdus rhamnosifermentans TaxID=2772457 RepID=UPI001C0626BC|nr:DNA polymerase III subunit delta [Pelorhabdus rhamnosifermentans]MBU2701475.1 DNA polymerase-3 subunit delta [Pelorhabdus rhamnosifermentans]
MDYVALQKDLKAGKIKPLYLLYGEEPYLFKEYQEQILKVLLTPDERDMNLITFDQDPSVAELQGIAEGFPFLGERNVLLVRNTRFFSAAKKGRSEEKGPQKDEDLLRFLEAIPKQTVLIFISYEKVDKRRKTFKIAFEVGAVLEAAPLKGRELQSWLEGTIGALGKNICSEALHEILTAVSLMPHASLNYLEQELTKIVLYLGERQEITVADVHMLLASVPEISVFVMMDALSRKNARLALAVLEEQIATGQAGLRLLALLARQVRQLYQAKIMIEEGFSSKEIGSYLKLMPFVTDRLIKQSRVFQLAQLKQALGLLSQADQDLKLNKGLVSLEKIIIYLCQ